MQSTVEIYSDVTSLHSAAAERIATSLVQILEEKELASFVLTGGETPEPIYALLASPPHLNRIDWPRVDFFWGDERCVPPESSESNFGMARDALLSKLGIPSSRIHRMIGELEDAEEAASLYEAEIRKALPGPGIPSFDLVLLGMGRDGHTASLFPGSQWDEEKLVVASRVPETGAARISMTPRILNEAGAILFLVAGSDKAAALAEILEAPAGRLPASRICPARGSLTWMIDRAAASLIRDSRFEIRD